MAAECISQTCKIHHETVFPPTVIQLSDNVQARNNFTNLRQINPRLYFEYVIRSKNNINLVNQMICYSDENYCIYENFPISSAMHQIIKTVHLLNN